MMEKSCRIDAEKYHAVLFDMDGVITDTMGLHYEAYRRAFMKYGIEVSKLEIVVLEGMPSMDVGREIVKAKAIRLGEPEIKNLVEEKREIYRSLVEKEARTYPGVPETLAILRKHGIRLALITGSNLITVKKTLQKVGLDKAFDMIVTADDTPRGKPYPDPYTSGMEKLGVQKENCVVVENAPLGIKSAKAAGAGYVIAVTTTLPPEYLKEADDIMPSFIDIQDCLARRLVDTRQPQPNH